MKRALMQSNDLFQGFPVMPMTDEQIRDIFENGASYGIFFDGHYWQWKKIGEGESGTGQMQGTRDASGGTLPTTRTDGSAIQKGDYWIINNGGTVSGLSPEEVLEVGDIIIATVDSPADSSGWTAVQGNLEGASAGLIEYIRNGYSTRFNENVNVTNVEEALDTIFQFTSVPPTAELRVTPTTIYYEVGDTANPVVEARGQLGQNPQGNLTLLRINKNGSSLQEWTNPTPNTWYSANDTVAITGTGEIVNYQSYVEDDQGRSDDSGLFRIYGTYPRYATTSDITTLTKQSLTQYQPSYFQGDFVAETDTDKQKAEFESGITITGVEFYNTVSGQREWLGGSKSNSLTYWDTSSVTNDVQGTTVNYTRYTHNGVKVGARQLRFHTD